MIRNSNARRAWWIGLLCLVLGAQLTPAQAATTALQVRSNVVAPNSTPPNGSGIPAWEIPGLGTYYQINRSETEYVLDSKPWGYIDRYGKFVFGHVSIRLLFKLGASYQGGMYAEVSYLNTSRFSDLVITGAMSDGKAGRANGGNVIHNCTLVQHPGIYPPDSRLGAYPYCLHKDDKRRDHNMTIQISWHRPGWKGYWFIYVRSVVAHTNHPGKSGYRFNVISQHNNLAGKDGNAKTQDHVRASNYAYRA